MAQCCLEFINSNGILTFVEELHHQVVIGLNSVLNEQTASSLCLVEHISWDLAHLKLVVGVVIIGVGFHVDKINHTTDILLKANWQVDWEGLLAEAIMD